MTLTVIFASHVERHDSQLKRQNYNLISIQISFNFDDQFFLIYFKTELLRINLKVEHCGAFYAPSNDIC